MSAELPPDPGTPPELLTLAGSLDILALIDAVADSLDAGAPVEAVGVAVREILTERERAVNALIGLAYTMVAVTGPLLPARPTVSAARAAAEHIRAHRARALNRRLP